MKIEQNQVREFMRKAGQECPSEPTVPLRDVQTLRLTLIREELCELDEAMRHDDIFETADAIGDLLVVVLGTAVACGIDIQPVWDEIHRSNMSKFIDGYRREDGKWMKGQSYSPANLAPIIESQINK